MSLWTPSGEHPIGDDRGTQQGAGTLGRSGSGPGGGPPPDAAEPDAGQEEVMRRQLAEAPAEIVIANHCYGLFELAAVYLSDAPPRLDQAKTAIDALGYLVDGLGARLGEAHPSLSDALAQIRLAFVQISAAATAGPVPDGHGQPT
ncbi:MAG: hypothetical protein ACRDWE_11870 [Acidimicrobiales bacterium]